VPIYDLLAHKAFEISECCITFASTVDAKTTHFCVADPFPLVLLESRPPSGALFDGALTATPAKQMG
jgi:hypothetical protein